MTCARPNNAGFHAFAFAMVLLPGLSAAEASPGARSGDRPMWGGSPDRNMVSGETGIPAQWDVKTGKNIKWTAPLGSPTYAAPVISGGRIFIGTNNRRELRKGITGDKGVMICLDEKTGRFQWQATHDKLPSGGENDWPEQGIPSMPYVDGDRLYYVSNRCELVCADVEGFLDDENDGPYKGEQHKTRQDADFVWILNMLADLKVFPHNLATCSPVGAGDLIFVTTSNGVDETHKNLPSPEAPSLIAVDKKTGRVIWQRSDPGKNILHGQWSSPAYGVIKGRPLVVFGAGDGWCTAHDAGTGNVVWRFDLNPKEATWATMGRGTRCGIIATPVIHDDRVFLSVGDDPDNGTGDGHLYCIDATKTGDITETGRIWHVGGEAFQRSLSTVAIANGLLYAADLTGYLHCFDLKTGKQHWVHDTFAAIWGSPYVVDGKVMIATTDGEVLVFAHDRTLKQLATNDMRNTIYTTPVAANGVLYVTNYQALFAIADAGAPEAARPTSKPAARRGGWPMFRGGPQLSGVAVCELPDKPAVLWKFDAGEAIGSSAAIAGGGAFLGCDNGRLYAFDLETGAVKWQYRTHWTDDPIPNPQSAIRNPRSSPSDEPGPAIRSSPLILGKTVFFGDEDGTFHAVDRETGRARWTFKADAEIISSANHASGRILFGSYDGRLYCLAPEDGRLLWKFETEGPVHAAPAIAGNHCFIAGCDGVLRVVRLEDGKQVRQIDIGDRSAASPAVHGSTIFLGTLGTQVLGLDWTTGRRLWTYEHPDRKFPFHASAAVTDRIVVIGGRDKIVHALDPKTGKSLWTFKTKARVDSSPVLVGARVFVGSSDGNLYALDLKTGRQAWRFEAGPPITASPAVGAGRLIISTEDGIVYCFGEKTVGQ